jgi:type VI secretion system protein ImpF
MATRPGNQQQLRPSLWDRLSVSSDEVSSAALRIDDRTLVASVRRDIERLLNTQRLDLPALEDLPEARTSILAYGLPDVSTFSGRSTLDRRAVCDLITEQLRRFEPRLVPGSIRVAYVEGGEAVGEGDASRARFRIHGVLHVEPLRQPVTFDTDVDMETAEVHIEEVDDA